MRHSKSKNQSIITVDMFFDPSDRIDLLLYTDGSCVNNGKTNAVGGIGIHFPKKELSDISKIFPLDNCTSQRTELYAILTALRYVKSKFNLKDYNLHIKTDSEYGVNCLTKWVNNWVNNGWTKQNGEPVLNRDLIEPIYRYFLKYHVALQHVKGHDDSKKTPDAVGNAKADKLAGMATQSALKKKRVLAYKKSKSGSGSKTDHVTKPRSTTRNKKLSNANELIIELVKSK